jgi:exonuclease SbcC
MIEEVRLLNFISHTRNTIPLKPGITIFVGRNGAGKSTVIDAVTYALYGQHMRGINETLVKDGAQGAAVSLYFSAGNKHYFVERKLNNKGQMEGAVLSEVMPAPERSVLRQLASGERKQLGESGVSGEVSRILGLDYEHMKIAGIIQQGELDSIINLGPKDLKDLVNSVTGTDRLDTAYAEMGKLLESFRGVIRSEYGGRDDTHIAALGGEISQNEQIYHASKVLLGTLQGELDSLESKRDDLSKGIEAMRPLKDKAEALRMKGGLLVSYVRRRRTELEESKKEKERTTISATSHLRLLAGESALTDALTRVSADQERNGSRLLQLSRDMGELRALKNKPAETDRKIAAARAALDLASRGKEIRASYSALESKVKFCEDELVRLEGAKGELRGYHESALKLEFKGHICPLCGSHVERINELFDRDSIERHLSEHEESIKRIRREKRDLDVKLKDGQGAAVALEQAEATLRDQAITSHSDLEKLERDNVELGAKVARLPEMEKEEIEAIKEQRVLKSRLEGLQKEVGDIRLAKQYLQERKISSSEDLSRLTTEIEKIGNTIESIPEEIDEFEEGALSTLDSTLLPRLSIDEQSEQLVGEIEELARAAASFDRGEYGELEKQLGKVQRMDIPAKNQEVGKCKNKMDEASEKLVVLNDDLRSLQEVADFVKTLQTIRNKVYYRDGDVSMSLRSWALTQIGSKASEYSRLFEIGVSQLTLKEKAKDMIIECYGKRGRVETSSMSGGEKVSIALALRFALAYVMGGSKLDFILLDEPTVHLDVERKSSLVEIIARLGGENSPLKQIVIITHDSEIFENAQVDEIWNFEQAPEGTRVMRTMGR